MKSVDAITRHIARFGVWYLLALYSVIFITLSSLRHYHFETQTWDMGIFAQTFWNATQGEGLQNRIEETHNHLGVHWSPILWLLVPGYAVFQSPYFLLAI